MSAYRHIIDIVSRTISILEKNNETEYETTLFLNCCLGLLIIPQQDKILKQLVSIGEIASYEDWGIDPDKNLGSDKNHSVDNIARH